MKTIQINYDLVAPGQNYEKLFGYVKSHGTWAKPLKSMFFVRTTKSAATVRDEIKAYTDNNDKVVVVDVTGDIWATTFSDDTTKWMVEQMRVGVHAS